MAAQIDESEFKIQFTRRALIALIVPLIIEQILGILMGIVDIMMVSGPGDAAVSGVSLVDMLCALFSNMFGALATGGAVLRVQDHEVLLRRAGGGERRDFCDAVVHPRLLLRFDGGGGAGADSHLYSQRVCDFSVDAGVCSAERDEGDGGREVRHGRFDGVDVCVPRAAVVGAEHGRGRRMVCDDR